MVKRFHHSRFLDWQVYDSVGSIFSTGWLIAGSVYVYGAAPTYEDANPRPPTYCEYSAYMYGHTVQIALSILGPKLLLSMGCVKLGEKNCVYLPSVGEQTAN